MLLQEFEDRKGTPARATWVRNQIDSEQQANRGERYAGIQVRFSVPIPIQDRLGARVILLIQREIGRQVLLNFSYALFHCSLNVFCAFWSQRLREEIYCVEQIKIAQ
jgi:hypothetical protein